MTALEKISWSIGKTIDHTWITFLDLPKDIWRNGQETQNCPCLSSLKPSSSEFKKNQVDTIHPCGVIWGLPGPPRSSLALPGSLWSSLALLGPPWPFLALLVPPWRSLALLDAFPTYLFFIFFATLESAPSISLEVFDLPKCPKSWIISYFLQESMSARCQPLHPEVIWYF